MEVSFSWLQIGSDVLILLLIPFLFFLKSYLKERVKNLATKKDIKEITTTVETIKNQLHFTTQSKLTLTDQERDAIVDFYTKYHCWLNTILDVSLEDIGIEDQVGFTEIKSRIFKSKFDFELATGRKDIFVRNEKLTEIQGKISIITLNLQHIVQKMILRIEQLHFEMLGTKELSLPRKEILEKYNEQLQEKTEKLLNFHKEIVEKYKEINRIGFIDSCALNRI